MSDTETIEVYNRQVDEYVAMAEDIPEIASVAAFVSMLQPAGHVLDLGCGPGQTAAHLQTLGFTVDAVDASAEMVRVAKARFGVEARCAAFSDINTTDHYDGIWANFSLLHAAEAEMPAILAALHRAMKAGGVLHLGMKTGEGSMRDRLGRFYSYYSEQTLRSLLVTAGFTVVSVQHGEGQGLAGTVEPWMLVLSRADKT